MVKFGIKGQKHYNLKRTKYVPWYVLKKESHHMALQIHSKLGRLQHKFVDPCLTFVTATQPDGRNI